MLTKANIVFAVEPFETIYADGKALFSAHWQEIAKDKEVMWLNEDTEFYLLRDKTKELLCISARDDGKLFGYFFWFLHTHPHYRHVLVAQSDIYYVNPSYRGSGYGQDLFQTAMDFAKKVGAGYCFISTKVGHDHSDLMARLGLKPRDLIYGRPL
jgi:GNAT superfamily N-acetyltransferase